MKNIIFIMLLFIGISACTEQELPEASVLDKSAFIATWTASEREVTLSNGLSDDDGNTYYLDSLVTEKIDITMTLSGQDNVTFNVIEYDSNNQPLSPKTVEANWSAGQTTGSEYLDGQKYIIVFDPTKPHQQKTDEWLTTYTIEDITGNKMILVWTLQNKTASNAKKFTATFTK